MLPSFRLIAATFLCSFLIAFVGLRLAATSRVASETTGASTPLQLQLTGADAASARSKRFTYLPANSGESTSVSYDTVLKVVILPLVAAASRAVAIAHPGDVKLGDSQMYIVLAPTPRLNGKFTVFGQVISGMDVVQKLKPNDVIRRVTVRMSEPGAK